MADALAKGADTIVTCGALQSNHCRLTLAAAVKEGLKCQLVLQEHEHRVFDDNALGNQQIFKLLGAEKTAAPKKVAVEFVADCPLATTVSVAGSFNNWTVDVDMLKKDKKTGMWVAKLNLVPGDYEYKFVCDGKNWDEGDNKIKHV